MVWLRAGCCCGARFVADFDGLYGGDEFAYKSASHELKGLRAYMQCELADLRTPLFCLVDFAGFRVIATSVLPLAKGSLVYGSCDAGACVLAWRLLWGATYGVWCVLCSVCSVCSVCAVCVLCCADALAAACCVLASYTAGCGATRSRRALWLLQSPSPRSPRRYVPHTAPPNRRAGRTVYSSLPKMNALMREAAAAINIQAHYVGRTQRRLIYSCTDIEGHKARAAVLPR